MAKKSLLIILCLMLVTVLASACSLAGGGTGSTDCEHTEVKDAAVAPTCTETGLTEGSHCSVCNEVIIAQETVKANGHTEVADAAVAPTCTETGLTEGSHCSVCEEPIIAQETVKANGHTEVADAAVAPTCTETGLTAGSHCSVCEEPIIAQETVKALGHSEVIDNAVSSSCTETGLTAGVHCSVCEETIIAQEIIPAAHSFSEWTRLSEPDCFFAGEETRACTVCGESETQEVAVLEHSFVQDEETKLFSCEKCDARILNGHLYAAFDYTVNWYDAYKICDTLGGYLVTITSSTEQALLNEIIGAKSFDWATGDGYFYFIGGIYNIDGWHWITGETMEYTNWSIRESSESAVGVVQWHIALATGKKAYSNAHVKPGEWEDLGHWLRHGFICEWELEIEESEHFFTEWETVKAASCFEDGEQYRICTHCGLEETEVITVEHNFVFNEATGITACENCSAAMYEGRIYKIFTFGQYLSWFDAYAYCENLGGHLVTITSAEEQTFIENYMTSLSISSITSIGAYNDGEKWNWVTGEEFDYSNWGIGEPNNNKNQEFFGEINYEVFGKWNDIPLVKHHLNVLCEWEAE